jgi:hypothetical protein
MGCAKWDAKLRPPLITVLMILEHWNCEACFSECLLFRCKRQNLGSTYGNVSSLRQKWYPSVHSNYVHSTDNKNEYCYSSYQETPRLYEIRTFITVSINTHHWTVISVAGDRWVLHPWTGNLERLCTLAERMSFYSDGCWSCWTRRRLIVICSRRIFRLQIFRVGMFQWWDNGTGRQSVPRFRRPIARIRTEWEC